jgi:hypothetical protein
MTVRARPTQAHRPVLYQVCRAAERFEVGDGPFDLQSLQRLVLGRGSEGGYDTRAHEDIIRVPDPWMSGRHVSLVRDGSGFRLADEGSTNGVLVNGRKATDVLLDNGDLIETGRTFWVYVLLPTDPPLPVEPVSFGALQTWNPAFAVQLLQLARAARTTQPVLLTGEVGTGKNYLARSIHEASVRSGRFLELDCSRLAPERAAQELFGAQDPRAGALHLSTAGTLFLSRVETLPLPVQDMLSQALETSRVQAVAGGKQSTVELRLVCAAEGDLEAAAARGRFSSRLHERLAQGTVRLPPLRARREDLGLLMESLLERADGAHTITRDACRALLNYPWPRNTRELSKVLEGGAILATDEGAVDLRHLPGVVAVRSGLGAPEQESGETPMVTGEFSRSLPLPHVDLTEDGSDRRVAPVASAGPPAPPPASATRASVAVRPPPPVRPALNEPTAAGDELDDAADGDMETGALPEAEAEPLSSDEVDAFENLSTDLPEGLVTDADQRIPPSLRREPRQPQRRETPPRPITRAVPLADPAPPRAAPPPSPAPPARPSKRVAAPAPTVPSRPPVSPAVPAPAAPAARGKIIRSKR